MLSVGSFALGLVIYLVATPAFSMGELFRVQLGAGFQPLPLPPETKQVFFWDLPFIFSYLLSLWWAAQLAVPFRGVLADVVRRRLRLLAVLAAVADLLEDLLVLASLRGSLPEPDVRAVLSLAAQAATVKYLCFIPAVLLGLALVAAALRRTAQSRGTGAAPQRKVEGD